MSKRLIRIIQKFESMIKREPPYGNYYNGDIIKWVNQKLEKESMGDKRLLRTNFYNISQTYISENKNNINKNVLNAQRVILEITEKTKFLKLKEDYDDAQLITLFRILQKELKIFKNSDEEVMDILLGVFDFGKDNIKAYFTRKKLKIKAKKLFRCEWSELYL
jgi:hypothetical protein